MKKTFFKILVGLLVVYITNLITYNYTIDLTNKNFSNKINNCFVDTDSLDSLKINLISQNQGFIAEIENNNDCLVLKKIDLNIEFIQEGLKDTLNLKINEEIKPFHIGSVYIESIQFDSNVKGAVVEMDGVEVGRTPHTMKVKKSFNGVMTISADGYEDKKFELQKSFNGIAILNLFSILGWGIDFATGALNKFDTKGYDITLDKE